MPLRLRPAAVADRFYPADRDRLGADIDRLLGAPLARSAPKALIVPHAGYVYSGPIAAEAYRLLQGHPEVQRVVLLGPAHFVRVRGLAAPTVDAFATPLGDVPLDPPGLKAVKRVAGVVEDDSAHAKEHSLEVQLPFLQRALGLFSLVPLAVGAASPAEVEGVLDAVWGGPETVVIISSDLSHYLPYEEAARIDAATADAILSARELSDPHRACGLAPLNGFLRAVRRRGLTGELLDLRNSGDTAGTRDSVVGYGAFAFREAK